MSRRGQKAASKDAARTPCTAAAPSARTYYSCTGAFASSRRRPENMLRLPKKLPLTDSCTQSDTQHRRAPLSLSRNLGPTPTLTCSAAMNDSSQPVNSGKLSSAVLYSDHLMSASSPRGSSYSTVSASGPEGKSCDCVHVAGVDRATDAPCIRPHMGLCTALSTTTLNVTTHPLGPGATPPVRLTQAQLAFLAERLAFNCFPSFALTGRESVFVTGQTQRKGFNEP
jgi:hypothetical protein